MTRTRRQLPHADVTLWFPLEAGPEQVTSYDSGEFTDIRWWPLADLREHLATPAADPPLPRRPRHRAILWRGPARDRETSIMDAAVVVAVYEAGDEDSRLRLVRKEWERTCELLLQWLPPAPARILDVGGASGRYAAWLQDAGHQVQVIDPVPRHVERARARGLRAQVGDARRLPFPDGDTNAVLMLGPLYHLPDPADRARALAEAVRICAPGGVVIVAAMSRWAKPAERAALNQLTDPDIRRHLATVLHHGHDADGSAFDRVSYNHDPAELRHELTAAGLHAVEVLGVEGPLGSFARQNTQLNDIALITARLAQQAAPHLSLHLLACGRPRPACPTEPDPT